MRELSRFFRRFLAAKDGSLREKTLRSGIWVAASSLGLGLLSLLRTVILARLLTPESFGLMAACFVVIRAIEVFTTTGLSAALIQRRGDVDEAMATVYSFTALRGLVLALVLAAISPHIAAFYSEPSLKSLLQVMAIALALSGLTNVNSIAAQKNLNFRPLFFLSQSIAIFDFIFTVMLALWWRSVWALVVGHVMKTLVMIPLSFLLLPGRPRFGWNVAIARELFGYGKYITGISIVLYITTEIDNVVIGKLLGMDMLGIYVLAYMLANLPATHLSKVISSVMFPAYSKLQGNMVALHEAYLQTTRVVATLAIPAAVGIAALADEIVQVVYGPQWTSASEVVPLLCIFGSLRSVSSVNGFVFNAIGKPNLSFYINLVKLVMIAILIVPATQQYGMQGAAMAITGPSALMFIVSYFVLSRTVGLDIRKMVFAILPATSAAIFMGLALTLSKHWVTIDTPLSLVLAVAVGAVIYAVVNWRQIRSTAALLTLR